MKHLLRCRLCDIYTMKISCPICQKKASQVKPPKYSPEDKYGKYRRMATLEQRKKEELV